MERGEFKQIVESVTSFSGYVDADKTLDEHYKEVVPITIIKLLGTICRRVCDNKKWATVTASYNKYSDCQQKVAYHAILGTSQFIQEEGYQTDETIADHDGKTYHQLTVFWADGKDIYEREVGLGVFNPGTLGDGVIVDIS